MDEQVNTLTVLGCLRRKQLRYHNTPRSVSFEVRYFTGQALHSLTIGSIYASIPLGDLESFYERIKRNNTGQLVALTIR